MRVKLERDLSVLSELKFSSTTSNSTLNLFKVDKLSSENIKQWLEDRVHYVIEEKAFSVLKLLVKKVVFIEKENVQFPHKNEIPFALDPTHSSIMDSEDEGVTVMSNTGAGLYLAGKKDNIVYGLKISRGLLKAPLKPVAESPRVGIIQIGEGLFGRQLTINNDNQESIANSINRLGTFFHEARHSDGHGVSLAFAHSICPKGHDLENLAACDENLNGPYAIGAAITLEMIKACGDECTPREKEMLTINALDSLSRVLKTTNKSKKPTTFWDETPESL